MTLAGFARAGRVNVYSPEHLRAAQPAAAG